MCSVHGYPTQRVASTPCPRSDRFWLLELRVSRTFLDQLRPQLLRPWIPNSARHRRWTPMIQRGRARRTISAGSWFGQWSPDPPVLCDRVSPCLRPLACHPQTTGRPNGDRSSSTASVDRRGPPLMLRAELGIHGLRSWGRNLSRKVRETRSSSSQKRSEPVAHPCRGPGGQAGDEHGGPPWFKGTRGRGYQLCDTNVSLYEIHFH